MHHVFRSFFAVLAAMVLFVASASAIVQKGQQAPPFKVVTTSGQQVSLANYKGYVLVLDFFTTWCPPCRESIPHLLDLNRKYGKQGLQIMGFSLDEGGDKVVKAFMTEKSITYPMAVIDDDLSADYGIRSIPTIYIINKKGTIVERYMGYNDEIGRSMEALIKKLLAE